MDGPPKDADEMLLHYAGHIASSRAIWKAQHDENEKLWTQLECLKEEFREFRAEMRKELRNMMWRMILVIGAASVIGSFIGGFASGN